MDSPSCGLSNSPQDCCLPPSGGRPVRTLPVPAQKKTRNLSCGSLLAGAGEFAKPRSKKQSAGLFLAAFGRPTCSNPTSSSTKKDPQPQLRISFGGSWWIRTTEALSSRFTVCPHWPLGKAPIFICAPALTVLD